MHQNYNVQHSNVLKLQPDELRRAFTTGVML